MSKKQLGAEIEIPIYGNYHLPSEPPSTASEDGVLQAQREGTRGQVGEDTKIHQPGLQL